MSKFVTISQAAQLLEVSIDTVRRWDRTGKIKSIRNNANQRMFSLDQLACHSGLDPESIKLKLINIDSRPYRTFGIRGNDNALPRNDNALPSKSFIFFIAFIIFFYVIQLQLSNIRLTSEVRPSQNDRTSEVIGEHTTADKTGSAILKAGENYINIPIAAITFDSKIFITPTSYTGGQQLTVYQKSPGIGFLVIIEKAHDKDISFDWLIINN